MPDYSFKKHPEKEGSWLVIVAGDALGRVWKPYKNYWQWQGNPNFPRCRSRAEAAERLIKSKGLVA